MFYLKIQITMNTANRRTIFATRKIVRVVSRAGEIINVNAQCKISINLMGDYYRARSANRYNFTRTRRTRARDMKTRC